MKQNNIKSQNSPTQWIYFL